MRALGRDVYSWLWCPHKLSPAQHLLLAGHVLSWVPTPSRHLRAASSPLFPTPLVPAYTGIDDFCLELFWAPDVGHKARVRNVQAILRCDQRLAFIVTESRGIWQKTARTEPGMQQL